MLGSLQTSIHHHPFFFFLFFQCLRDNHGVFEASWHVPSAHRRRVRDQVQVEQRNQSCSDAPGRVRMGLSCHKPALGVWVGLLQDGNQCYSCELPLRVFPCDFTRARLTKKLLYTGAGREHIKAALGDRLAFLLIYYHLSSDDFLSFFFSLSLFSIFFCFCTIHFSPSHSLSDKNKKCGSCVLFCF